MKKILTVIFDGFGFKEDEYGNAVKNAHMETFNDLWNNYPHSLLKASEEAVGLTKGQMGNSEVGHTTIGSGRLVPQNEVIVNKFLEEGYKNNELFKVILANPEKRIHIMGLASDGNVHAGIDDFLNLFNILVTNNFKDIYFHLITDGRDTDIHSSYSYIDLIDKKIKEYNVGKIATICGRYYAMDRDKNYDRTKIYYDLVTKGRGISVLDIKKGIDSSYEKNVTDEFIKPMLINAEGLIKENDIIIWMNYREDRSKQIMSAFTNPSFEEFDTVFYTNLDVYSFLPIDKKINTKNFMEADVVDNSLGLYLSKLGFTQARIAESEKYPHVTYFFDCGYNGKIPGCDKYEIPSKKVATYDLAPEMSCEDVTRRVIKCMEADYDFILVNYANPDMVGHTGNMEATTVACKYLDACLKKLLEVAEDNFYKIILFADHGNADTMLDNFGNPCTTHSLSLVPFIIKDSKLELYPDGDLTMIAPTILNYMDIAVPKEMQNTPLLIKKKLD